MAHVSANVVQQSFRGRNDDGTESGASWKQLANVDWTQNVDEIFRVRFLVQETAGGSANNLDLVIEFNLNAGGWVAVGAATAIQLAASGTVADGTATTQQIGAGTFVTGEFDSNGTVNPVTLSNSETEMEYCLTVDSAQVADTDTFQLRVTDGGAALNAYTNTPTVTVSEAVPDDLLADDLQSLSQLSTPDVGQEHVITADDLQSISELSTPSVGQEHAITADDLQSLSQLSTPALAEVAPHALLADDLQSLSQLSTPSLTEITPDILLADDLQSLSELSTPAIGQTHVITSDGLESASEVGTPAIGQTHSIGSDNIQSASELSSPTIGQEHDLSAGGIESASELSRPSLVDAPPPVKSISCILITRSGVIRPGLSALQWAWFDESTPDVFSTPTDSGDAEETDIAGEISVDLPNTTLAIGQIGTLVLRGSDGSYGSYNLEVQ